MEVKKNHLWIGAIIIIAIIAVFLIVGSGGVTGKAIADDFVSYLNSASDSEVKLIDISKHENTGLYLVLIEYQGQEIPLYVTKDGSYYITNLIPIEEQGSSEQNTQTQPPGNAEPMLGCVESYGITEDTIIFYYSNSCGWCTKMKPGVEALEKEGYNFKWIEASNAEDSEIINDCIRDHMTSGGIPQFICPKTDEIHVGAFTDSSRNLDQLALKEWVDNCLSN